jgi:prophage endopeptidase
MNEQVAKLLAYLAVALALIGVGAGAAWEWQANAYGKIIASNEAARQADLSKVATAAADQSRQALDKQQAAEQKLSDLDTKATKEKSDDLAENQLLLSLYTSASTDNAQLRADVDSGKRRLRIAGTCTAPTSGGNMSEAASTSSVGDAGAVELTATAGQAVFDIRAGIIADQAALKAAQDYIRNVCQ